MNEEDFIKIALENNITLYENGVRGFPILDDDGNVEENADEMLMKESWFQLDEANAEAHISFSKLLRESSLSRKKKYGTWEYNSRGERLEQRLLTQEDVHIFYSCILLLSVEEDLHKQVI